MRVIIEKDYEQMSKTVMHLLLAQMYKPRPVHMSITAGSTPARLYELLTEEIKSKAPFTNVTYYNFDEIPIVGQGGYGVTMSNLDKMYFQPAGIDKKYIHVLDETNYTTHDEYLKSVGGLDSILLGIGGDGHFCGNLPKTTKFSDETTKVDLNSRPDMKEILQGEVGGEDKVPDFYVTMGPKSVMAVKEIVMFANGTKKAEIVKKAFWGPVTEDVPSSILQLHPNFTLVLDAEAASLMK